jgi:hypothetical protein
MMIFTYMIYIITLGQCRTYPFWVAEDSNKQLSSVIDDSMISIYYVLYFPYFKTIPQYRVFEDGIKKVRVVKESIKRIPCFRKWRLRGLFDQTLC